MIILKDPFAPLITVILFIGSTIGSVQFTRMTKNPKLKNDRTGIIMGAVFMSILAFITFLVLLIEFINYISTKIK
jgi:hypothetical protein